MKNRVVTLVFELLFAGLLLSLFLACSFRYPIFGYGGWGDGSGGPYIRGWDDDARWVGAGTGHVTVEGQTYSLTKLHFVDYGEWDTGVYNVNLYMMSEGLDRGVYSGVGEYVFLQMYFDKPSVFSGTYNHSYDRRIYLPGTPGTFWVTSCIRIGYSPSADRGEAYYFMRFGRVNISIDGPECTINGDVTVRTGTGDVNATFSFNGSLTGDILPTALKH